MILTLQQSNIRLEKLKESYSISVNYQMISRYMTCLDTNNHQPQGRDPRAGMKHASKPSGTDRGMSRLPRSRGVVVDVPHARGGRRCHPLQVNRNIKMYLNKKERKQAQTGILAHVIHSNIRIIDYTSYEKTKSFVQDLRTVVQVSANSRIVHTGRHQVKKHTKSVLVCYSNPTQVQALRNVTGLVFCNISEGNRLYNAIARNSVWRMVLIDESTVSILESRLQSNE
jgi:ribosomal protein L4